jgi:hypothetical protein
MGNRNPTPGSGHSTTAASSAAAIAAALTPGIPIEAVTHWLESATIRLLSAPTLAPRSELYESEASPLAEAIVATGY